MKKCERLYEQEGDLTETFRAFNDFRLVCIACYADLKSKHSNVHG